jgi:hypothetical protein
MDNKSLLVYAVTLVYLISFNSLLFNMHANTLSNLLLRYNSADIIYLSYGVFESYNRCTIIMADTDTPKRINNISQ